MDIINCTPHQVKVGNKVFEPSGIIPRLKEKIRPAFTVDGIEIVRKGFEEVENLPERRPETLLIVSALVSGAVKRGDLVVPDGLIRDDKGNILGAQRLAFLD